jgi:hypothetical protein
MRKQVKLILLATLFVITVVACNKKREYIHNTVSDEVEEIIVDSKKGPFYSTDNLIESAFFVKLETSNDCLIGAVDQILFKDSLMIVVDKKHANAICVFDMQGRFKYRIGKRGQGPEEYVEIRRVCLVPGKDEICLLDYAQRKVLFYNIEGEFLRYERIPFLMRYFEYLPSGNKAYNEEIFPMREQAFGKYINNTLIVTDNKNNILYGACKDARTEKFNYALPNPLRNFGGEIFYNPAYTDTIYYITDTTAIAKYAINILYNKIPKFDGNTTNEIFESYWNGPYIYFEGEFAELKDLTFIQINLPVSDDFLLYSHKTKQTYLNNGETVHPIKFFANKINSPIARYGENTVVFDLESHKILDYKEHLYNDKKNRAVLDSLYDGLTEDSNPVLFFYKMRTDFE